MAYRSLIDNILAGQWSIREMTAIANSMISEAERHVIQKESLPHGLVQSLHETINKIEAEILRRRAELSLLQRHLEGCDAGLTSPQREVAIHTPPPPSAYQETDFQTCLEAKQVSNEDLDRQSANKDSQPAMGDKRGVLDSLQDNIKAIQSVVILHMTDAVPTTSKTRTTSSVVSFSILEEEMKILDCLSKHVLEASKQPEDQNTGLLERGLMALLAQLSALFNMEIREAAQEGSEIDEKHMIYMVVRNQKRTGVLRRIEMAADRVKEVMRITQDDARNGHRPSCA